MTSNPTEMWPPAVVHPSPGRIEQPPADLLAQPHHDISELACALRDAHNATLRDFGSRCGGKHAFDPVTRRTVGVYDGSGGFPDGTVVSRLSWGRITESIAQRLLETDGVNTEGN